MQYHAGLRLQLATGAMVGRQRVNLMVAFTQDADRIWAQTLEKLANYLSVSRLSRRLGDEEIEDVASETVYRLWIRQREKPIPKEDLLYMGIRIAKNVIIDKNRK